MLLHWEGLTQTVRTYQFTEGLLQSATMKDSNNLQ
jgi:hypothetical protein